MNQKHLDKLFKGKNEIILTLEDQPLLESGALRSDFDIKGINLSFFDNLETTNLDSISSKEDIDIPTSNSLGSSVQGENATALTSLYQSQYKPPRKHVRRTKQPPIAKDILEKENLKILEKLKTGGVFRTAAENPDKPDTAIMISELSSLFPTVPNLQVSKSEILSSNAIQLETISSVQPQPLEEQNLSKVPDFIGTNEFHIGNGVCNAIRYLKLRGRLSRLAAKDDEIRLEYRDDDGDLITNPKQQYKHFSRAFHKRQPGPKNREKYHRRKEARIRAEKGEKGSSARLAVSLLKTVSKKDLI